MNRYLLFLICTVSVLYSCIDGAPGNKEASFPGGNQALQRYIIDEVEYPQLAIEQNEQGKVLVQFDVEKNGEISNVNLIESVSPELDKEAIRLIENMPKWEPARISGRPTKTECIIPITFTLD